MLGFWESKINVRYEEAQEMSLDHILRNANAGDDALALNEKFRTIRYISDKEYYDDVYKYVEPLFSLASADNLSPRFIIFSAPGATGKTALANISVIIKVVFIGICPIIKWPNTVCRGRCRML